MRTNRAVGQAAVLLVPDFPLKTVVVSIENGPYVEWIVVKAEGQEEASCARVVTRPPGTRSVGDTGAPQAAAPVATRGALVPWDTAHTRSVCPGPALGVPGASPRGSTSTSGERCLPGLFPGFCGEEEQPWPAWSGGAVTQSWHMVWPQ